MVLQRVYLDSNVFIAFIKSEMGKPFRLMFRDVEDFLAVCPEKYVLVLSDHTLNEINRIVHYSGQSTIKLLEGMEIGVEQVETSETDNKKAGGFCRKGMHFADALHAALAINSECDFLLTFNKKDFEPVGELVEIVEPIDLIV